MINFSSQGVYSCIWSSGGKELYRGNYSVNKNMNWYEVLGKAAEKDFGADELISLSGFDWQEC